MQYSQKRKMAINLMGGKCVRCGFKDRRALQIDHINGNGADERRQYGMATNEVIFEKIIAGQTADYQLLCANCNWIKRYDNHEARVCSSNYSRLKHKSRKYSDLDNVLIKASK